MKKINLSKGGSLRGRMLRLLGISKDFEQFLSDQGALVSQKYSQVPKKKSSNFLFNVEVYLLSDARKDEVEAQKAIVVAEARHHDWKAGGPN